MWAQVLSSVFDMSSPIVSTFVQDPERLRFRKLSGGFLFLRDACRFFFDESLTLYSFRRFRRVAGQHGLSIEPNCYEDPHHRHCEAYRRKRANREVQCGSDEDYGGLQHVAQANAKRFDGSIG